MNMVSIANKTLKVMTIAKSCLYVYYNASNYATVKTINNARN